MAYTRALHDACVHVAGDQLRGRGDLVGGALPRCDLRHDGGASDFRSPAGRGVIKRLGMPFACAHPALSPSVRGPLMLQTVLGLHAARIASACLVAPAAMSQRLVRAKRKIAATRIPPSVPDAHGLPARL